MQTFFDLIAARATCEGYKAYTRGAVRHAPSRFGEFCGEWVKGWDEAALDEISIVTLK